MKLDLEKQTYFEIKKISNIKNYNYELDEVKINDTDITANLFIELFYFDQDGKLINQKLAIPIEIFSESSVSNPKIVVKELKFEVIEGQGVTANFKLELNYEKKDGASPIPALIQPEVPEIKEKAIVRTRGNNNENDFLDLFKNEEGHYSVKCLRVKDEAQLKVISEKYQIMLDDLYKGYDASLGYVLFNARSKSN